MRFVAQGPDDLVPWLHAVMQYAQDDYAATSVWQEAFDVVKSVCGSPTPACRQFQMEKPDTS